MQSESSSPAPRIWKRLLKWAAIALLVVVAALAVAVGVAAHRAAPLLKARIAETLRASFHGRVDLGNVDVAAWHGFEVTGDNLRIYSPETLANAAPDQPLIALKHFEFHATLAGLLFTPTHVSLVRVEQLEIDIPPGGMHAEVSSAEKQEKKHRDKIQILVDEIVCDNSRLTIGNSNPDKGPKIFELKHIELHNVGGQSPWRYRTTLINAVPRGEIQSAGNFGPWNVDSPGDTAVHGQYSFQHADLNTIRGLGGMLSSTGNFQGRLNEIIVDGTTETPDFSLDTANHPVPLHTKFHAIVDGITGDTYLQPVEAKLRNSSFTCKGAVIDIKGKGHEINLDVDVPAAQLQDFLDLAVKTQPPVLTAIIGTKAKLHIRPGKERVVQKLTIQAKFSLHSMHFTNPEVQDKVDMLSLRAQGEPQKAKPGATDVISGMTGTFNLQHDEIQFSQLRYSLPGAKVILEGVYSLNGEVFDFRGDVLTDVPVSKMVASRWASLALRVVNPFFRRKGATGADIPVKISGTRSAPKFGLDLVGRHAHEGKS